MLVLALRWLIAIGLDNGLGVVPKNIPSWIPRHKTFTGIVAAARMR